MTILLTAMSAAAASAAAAQAVFSNGKAVFGVSANANDFIVQQWSDQRRDFEFLTNVPNPSGFAEQVVIARPRVDGCDLFALRNGDWGLVALDLTSHGIETRLLMRGSSMPPPVVYSLSHASLLVVGQGESAILMNGDRCNPAGVSAISAYSPSAAFRRGRLAMVGTGITLLAEPGTPCGVWHKINEVRFTEAAQQVGALPRGWVVLLASERNAKRAVIVDDELNPSGAVDLRSNASQSVINYEDGVLILSESPTDSGVLFKGTEAFTFVPPPGGVLIPAPTTQPLLFLAHGQIVRVPALLPLPVVRVVGQWWMGNAKIVTPIEARLVQICCVVLLVGVALGLTALVRARRGHAT